MHLASCPGVDHGYAGIVACGEQSVAHPRVTDGDHAGAAERNYPQLLDTLAEVVQKPVTVGDRTMGLLE